MTLKSTPDSLLSFDDEDDNDGLLPDRLLSGFELEGLVRTLMRQQANAVRRIESKSAARLFEITERWAVSHVKNDPAIKIIEDNFSFELAMRDPDVAIVLVPSSHDMQPEQIDRLCLRAPKGKTIFIDKSK